MLDTLDTPAGTVAAAFQCAVTDHCVAVIGAAYSQYSMLVQYVLQNYSVCLIYAPLNIFFKFRSNTNVKYRYLRYRQYQQQRSSRIRHSTRRSSGQSQQTLPQGQPSLRLVMRDGSREIRREKEQERQEERRRRKETCIYVLLYRSSHISSGSKLR